MNVRRKILRAVQLSDPSRGELELQIYGRPHFEALADQACLSLLLLTFIDAFGAYRNIYRSLLGIYNTPANLPSMERGRRHNVLTLTLGPHGSSFEDVISVLEPSLAALDAGVKMQIGGKETFVCAYTMAFIGDMPQQNGNAGFMSQKANRGCRTCLAEHDDLGDLGYDLFLHRRYHYQVINDRKKAKAIVSKINRAKFFNLLGIREQPSPLVRVNPVLDLIRSVPADAAYSEYADIAKQSQGLFFSVILTPSAEIEYCAELRRFPFPPL